MTKMSDQVMLETIEGCFFTSIGNLQKKGMYIGLLIYVPLEERHRDEPVIKTKMIGGREYGKMSTLWHWRSHEAYFHYLSNFSHYFYEDKFFGKVIAIPEGAVKRRFPPKQVADDSMDSAIEESCKLLRIDRNKTAQTGSILLTGRNGHDVDLCIYGRRNVAEAVKNLRILLQKSECQEIRYERVHQKMMRLNGVLIDLFPLYDEGENLPFSGMPEYVGGPFTIEDLVYDEYDGGFTPSVYKLESGRLLVTYQIGHKLLLRKGDHISVKIHEVRLQENSTECDNIAYLIRLGDEWEDPTADKRFSKDGT